ncbi:luciferase [Halogeometricum sp. S1BR25-6]|uniref:Luciferase n=1 Tax=Halogeometricum salsisoli TaxID=2950536 RepID=A0ABU2GCD5_9EURY|nr:luciferase [Halogeometricum sp. S1BR25-6]MDS0297949.1 luciferase [Halogeometricum sp. S1BR25-6]
MLTGECAVSQTGLDAVALKPKECDVRAALDTPFDTVAVDYEGREHLPDAEVLRELAADREVRLTMPVRADGFDPTGDDDLWNWVPEGVRRVFVAGHAAYLSEEERRRAVAPRLAAGLERAPEAWVGTEGVERVALAAGGTQYELLSRSTETDLRALRATGYDGEIAVYAPTVLADDEDEILDGVGAYAARRRPVAKALPTDAATDARAEGRAREVLGKAVRDYALVGDVETVRDRVSSIKEAGADIVVGYPARGVEKFSE